MKTISYARLQKTYSGEYIARKDGKVLVHAKSYNQLTKKLFQQHLDRSDLVIGFVPPKSTICIYAS